MRVVKADKGTCLNCNKSYQRYRDIPFCELINPAFCNECMIIPDLENAQVITKKEWNAELQRRKEILGL